MAEVKCILAEQAGKGGSGSSSIVPTKLTITRNPTKLVYREDDTFVIAGLQGVVSYGVQGSALEMGTATIPDQISLANLIFSPSGPLTVDDAKITVTYTENDISVSADIDIIVRSSSLNITAPTKDTYDWGESFNASGMSVETLDGVPVTEYSMSVNGVTLINGVVLNNEDNLVIGANIVEISYTDSDGILQTGVFTLTINKAPLAIPTQSGTLTYDPDMTDGQTPAWDNYNTERMDLSVTAQVNAGNWQAQFTIKDPEHYQWSDKTTVSKTVTWVIQKRALTDSDVNVADLALTANIQSGSVTITIPTGAGSISISPTEMPLGLTMTPNPQSGYSRQYDFQADGNEDHAASQSFKVTVTEGDNYLGGEFENKFTVSITYWEWGSETANADADWWAGLKNWIAGASTAELNACVGKTKSVTLTAAVLGTTTHLVRCIGYNCNRDKNDKTRNTLTFETANCMAQTTVFGTSNALWTGSTVRAKCQEYYNAFPGKASVSTVSIGSATTTNSNQNATPTYTDETVFLASDAEHGFPAGKDYNNGKGYAASYNEFDKENTSKTPYQYCTSNERRIKKLGDNGSANYYWERSLYYNNTNVACRVLSDGKPNRDSYGSADGLAPAFVI